jgi:hypothetical protein
MATKSDNSKSLYFALVGTGAFVVACAAFWSYLLSLGLNAAPLSGQEVARRMVIILFLVVTVFELALYLLHRVIARMDAVINSQKEELESYARQLEVVVVEQLARIQKIAHPEATPTSAPPTPPTP